MNLVDFNQEKQTIQIKSQGGECLYEIPLQQIEEQPNISKILAEISQQKWCNPEILDSLVKILDEVCSQTDNSCQPGIFCPFGLIGQTTYFS